MTKKKSIFFDLTSYGMGEFFTVPDMDTIIDLSNILCIGGGIMFVPLMNGTSELTEKEISVFVSNNNSIYMDDYIPKPFVTKYNTFIPRQFRLTGYIKLYMYFRTFYRRSGFDDYFDIFINMLKTQLDDYTKSKDADEISKGLVGFLLAFVERLQRGFTIDQAYADKEGAAKLNSSKIALTENQALRTKFRDEIIALLNANTTLFTVKGIVAGRDAVAVGNSDQVVDGFNVLGAIGAVANQIDLLDGYWLDLLYKMMEITWQYVQVPMPIHIPGRGWVYGYVQAKALKQDDNAGNIYPIEITVIQREVAKSTFVNVLNERREDIKKNVKQSEPVAPSSTIFCGLPPRDAFLKKARSQNINITKEQYAKYCEFYSKEPGVKGISQTLSDEFGLAITGATEDIQNFKGAFVVGSEATKLAISMSNNEFGLAKEQVPKVLNKKVNLVKPKTNSANISTYLPPK